MSSVSTISWTDATYNPYVGCKKVSDACKYCYMHRIIDGQGRNPNQIFLNKKEVKKPMLWAKGKKIFTCSMSDFFIEEADEWRNQIWDVIKNTQRHTYLILTKRPERIKECLPSDWSSRNYSNVWIGVTVESEKHLHRIHALKDIPCAVKWVSFEPLLEPIYLTDKELSIIQWAVLGGESGNETGKFKYRKTELNWFLSLMYQLRANQTPIFFKQFGTWYHKNQFLLKDKKGEKYCKSFPNGFKIRQYPN